MSEKKKQLVAADLLQVAAMYNNILYFENYVKYGNYSRKDIEACFESFSKACRVLKIIDPRDPHDLSAVLNDIRFVRNQQKQISRQIYENFGIYTMPELLKKYGKFESLMAMLDEKSRPSGRYYPVYPVIRDGRHIMLYR